MNTVTLTPELVSRASKDFNSISGEIGRTEAIKGTLYYYGTELGTLRLLKKYRQTVKADQGYSETMCTFYFRLEM